MTNRLRQWATLLYTLMCIDTVACAANPLEFFEVVNVTPSRAIKHKVQSKSPFDNDVIETVLTGPRFFSHAVGFIDPCAANGPIASEETRSVPETTNQPDGIGRAGVNNHEAIQEPRAYLNWYEIAQPPKEPRRTVVVRDPLRGNDAHSITIGSSAFLLSPAQRITTGSPSPIPGGLNYFKAYRILDAPLVRQMVKLMGSLGPEDRTATRAILLCVPIEQWHHDEHVRVKDSQDCLIVYELLPQKHSLSISTIDQFGLNELDAQSSNWLCVRVTRSEPAPMAAK